MSIIFFLLSPFLSFVYSCANLRKRINQVIFVLFFGLFGFCHTFTDTRADAYRKYESFNNYFRQSYSNVFGDYANGEIKDLFEGLLYAFIKGFTDNPHILMMVVGLIGGFFYMLVVKRFLQDKVMSYNLPIIILLFFIVIESNIALMGGIRNFVAFPVFIYSVIRLLIDGEKKWVIGLLLTPFIHFSYIIVAVVAILVWIIKIPNSILHYLTIAVCAMSLFVNTSSYTELLSTVVDIAMDDNEAIAERVEHYGDDSTTIHFEKSLTTRLLRVNNKIGACFMIAFLIYMRRKMKQLRVRDYDMKLYNTMLVFSLVAYSLISFSVVGQRFVYIAMVLLYMLLLNIYQQNPQKNIRYFIYAMPMVYALHIAWFFYNCYCNTGAGIFFKPLFMLFM